MPRPQIMAVWRGSRVPCPSTTAACSSAEVEDLVHPVISAATAAPAATPLRTHIHPDMRAIQTRTSPLARARPGAARCVSKAEASGPGFARAGGTVERQQRCGASIKGRGLAGACELWPELSALRCFQPSTRLEQAGNWARTPASAQAPPHPAAQPHARTTPCPCSTSPYPTTFPAHAHMRRPLALPTSPTPPQRCVPLSPAHRVPGYTSGQRTGRLVLQAQKQGPGGSHGNGVGRKEEPPLLTQAEWESGLEPQEKLQLAFGRLQVGYVFVQLGWGMGLRHGSRSGSCAEAAPQEAQAGAAGDYLPCGCCNMHMCFDVLRAPCRALARKHGARTHTPHYPCLARWAAAGLTCGAMTETLTASCAPRPCQARWEAVEHKKTAIATVTGIVAGLYLSGGHEWLTPPQHVDGAKWVAGHVTHAM